MLSTMFALIVISIYMFILSFVNPNIYLLHLRSCFGVAFVTTAIGLVGLVYSPEILLQEVDINLYLLK